MEEPFQTDNSGSLNNPDRRRLLKCKAVWRFVLVRRRGCLISVLILRDNHAMLLFLMDSRSLVQHVVYRVT